VKNKNTYNKPEPSEKHKIILGEQILGGTVLSEENERETRPSQNNEEIYNNILRLLSPGMGGGETIEVEDANLYMKYLWNNKILDMVWTGDRREEMRNVLPIIESSTGSTAGGSTNDLISYVIRKYIDFVRSVETIDERQLRGSEFERLKELARINNRLLSQRGRNDLARKLKAWKPLLDTCYDNNRANNLKNKINVVFSKLNNDNNKRAFAFLLATSIIARVSGDRVRDGGYSWFYNLLSKSLGLSSCPWLGDAIAVIYILDLLGYGPVNSQNLSGRVSLSVDVIKEIVGALLDP